MSDSENLEKEAFVYCISTIDPPTRTYIGATTDVDRRLRQHNGELSGGARKV
jgi:structure-specific endonuclease subunit SLX1